MKFFKAMILSHCRVENDLVHFQNFFEAGILLPCVLQKMKMKFRGFEHGSIISGSLVFPFNITASLEA